MPASDISRITSASDDTGSGDDLPWLEIRPLCPQAGQDLLHRGAVGAVRVPDEQPDLTAIVDQPPDEAGDVGDVGRVDRVGLLGGRRWSRSKPSRLPRPSAGRQGHATAPEGRTRGRGKRGHAADVQAAAAHRVTRVGIAVRAEEGQPRRRF